MNTMPKPSPTAHTPATQANDRSRAGLTVARDRRPIPIRSWAAANTALKPRGWRATRSASSWIGQAMTAGCPVADGASTWWAKAVVNMLGCSCSRPSPIQSTPSAIWMVRTVRRIGDASGARLIPDRS